MPYVTRGGQRVRHTKEPVTPAETEPFYDAVVDSAYRGAEGREYPAGPHRTWRMYRTIQAAMGGKGKGRILIRPGTYDEVVDLSKEPYLPPEHPLRLTFERMEWSIWAYIRRQEAVSRETEG